MGKRVFLALLAVTLVAGGVFAQEGIFDYICVYNKNESGFFLDQKPIRFLNTEGFSFNKTSYRYQTTDSEVVINAHLTWAAILKPGNRYDVQINGKKKERSYTLNDGINNFSIDVLDAGRVLATYTVTLEKTSSAPTPPPAPPGPVLSGVSVSKSSSGTIYVDIRTETQRVQTEQANFEIVWKNWARGMTAESLRNAEGASDDGTWKTMGNPVQYGSQAQPGLRYSITSRPFGGNTGFGTDGNIVVRGRTKDSRGWGPWVYFLGGANSDAPLP